MSVLHDGVPCATPVTQLVGEPASVVEKATYSALRRLHVAKMQATAISDPAIRLPRMAELYGREARWWRVLARHCNPYLPYLTAVLHAESACRDWARQYRDWAAESWTRGAA